MTHGKKTLMSYLRNSIVEVKLSLNPFTRGFWDISASATGPTQRWPDIYGVIIKVVFLTFYVTFDTDRYNDDDEFEDIKTNEDELPEEDAL